MRLLRIVLLALSISAFPPLGLAQEGTDLAPQEKEISKLMGRFEKDFAYLDNFDQIKIATSDQERAALLYRRDTRALKLILDAITIADALIALPEDNATRFTVENQLRQALTEIDKLVINALNQLNERINRAAEDLPNLSSADLFQRRAYIRNLQQLRYQALKSMAQLIPTLETLGLPSESFRDEVEMILTRQAERLVGLLAFSEAATLELAEESAANPGDASLVTAYTEIQARHEQELQQLIQITEALELIGVRTEAYRAVIVKQRGILSIDIFKGRILKNIIFEYWESVKHYFKTNAADTILKTLFIIFILLAARALARLARRATKAAVQRSKSGLSQLHKNVLVSASGAIVMGIGLLIAIGQLGISLGPMLAGLGIVGFIVGFALQDSLANFAAGAMILIYRPFDVDDFVQVAGQEGLVKKMSLVSTTIHTFDNQTLVVPNNKIWGDVIKNVTAQHVRRIDLEFRVSYDSDIEHVERVLWDVITEHPNVLPEPKPNIRVHSLEHSAMTFIARPWARRDDVWVTRWELIRSVKIRFDKEGIVIPFPQQDVHITHSSKGAGTAGAESHQGKE